MVQSARERARYKRPETRILNTTGKRSDPTDIVPQRIWALTGVYPSDGVELSVLGVQFCVLPGLKNRYSLK